MFIRHFHIPHNTTCLLPKILHNLCFPFPQGITVVPRETEDNAYAKCLGENKVYYGGCGNGDRARLNFQAFSLREMNGGKKKLSHRSKDELSL